MISNDIVNRLLRGTLFILLIALCPLTVMVLFPLLNSQYIAPSALPSFILLSVGFGMIAYLIGTFAGHLQRQVGRLTAFAAIAGGTALVGTALALMLGTCPGSLSGEACTVQEASSWGLSMSLLVILLTISWVFLTGAIRGLVKGGRAYLKRRREQADETAQEELEQEAEEGRAQARDRDPQAPKGYSTPRRTQRKKRKNKQKSRKA